MQQLAEPVTQEVLDRFVDGEVTLESGESQMLYRGTLKAIHPQGDWTKITVLYHSFARGKLRDRHDVKWIESKVTNPAEANLFGAGYIDDNGHLVFDEERSRRSVAVIAPP